MSLERARLAISEALEELRAGVFVPEARERYKLTFVARCPDNPELDIVVTEDGEKELLALVSRRLVVSSKLREKNPDRCPWPDAVSDGLTLRCSDCGERPRFDYRVEDSFWAEHVPGDARLGVVCLPCLDRRCDGVGLADALIEVQWTGTRHTVVLVPSIIFGYDKQGEKGDE